MAYLSALFHLPERARLKIVLEEVVKAAIASVPAEHIKLVAHHNTGSTAARARNAAVALTAEKVWYGDVHEE